MRTPTIIAMGVLSVGLLGCEPDEWTPDQLGHGKTSATVQQLKKGQIVYANYCAGCHGEQGDGNGQAAKFLNPKPRNFKQGRIKFANVPSGQAPRDEDYLAVIEGGLSGTAMPSFKLLPKDEKVALVAYVKTFYTEWADDPPGNSLPIMSDPFIGKEAEGIELGRQVYHSVALCYSCHPGYETPDAIAKIYTDKGEPAPDLRANLYEGELKESSWGDPIRAPDFLVDRIKNGIEVGPLARIIGAGIGGTAMPTWVGALDPEDPDNEAKMIWAIAYYVRDVAVLRGTAEGRALKQKLLASPIPAPKPAEEAPAPAEQPAEAPAEKPAEPTK